MLYLLRKAFLKRYSIHSNGSRYAIYDNHNMSYVVIYKSFTDSEEHRDIHRDISVSSVMDEAYSTSYHTLSEARSDKAELLSLNKPWEVEE